MKNKIKIALAFAIALGIAILFIPNRATYTAEADEQYPISHEQKVWMHTLEFCESRGDASIKYLDSNNRYSYGVLQFQMETFLREGKKYGLIDEKMTAEEGEVAIHDAELQEKIAHRMLLDGGEGNWFNCFKKNLREKYPKL